jgi:Domain of unknown function (DUF4145)
MAEGREDWSPGDAEYRFSALLECKNHLCREVIAIAGHGHGYYEQVYYSDPETGDSESDMTYTEKFYPNYINPSPALIVIPTLCPKNIKEELSKAFISSWGDPYAALNYIRSSVEQLLGHLKIESMQIKPSGESIRIPLHNRILILSTQNKLIGDCLQAIKWLGNAGSHADEISRNDVYDALDIIEMVLDDLFVRHREKLISLISVINEQKGPSRG